MTDKQSQVIEQLKAHLADVCLEIAETHEIDYALQFKITNGKEFCLVNVYTSGKVTVGGKKNHLRDQMTEWKNLQQAGIQASTAQPEDGATLSRATKFFVALPKVDKIRTLVAELPGEITWYEGDPDSPQFYRAEIRANGSKVVITQYRTGNLMVQGRASVLFDQVCERLDHKLSQTIADRATRYIPEATRDEALKAMNQPETEDEALAWVLESIGQATYEFLYPHDQETLLSAAALLQAVEAIDLRLPDYSVLVMPFARAYEGFLLKLFVHIGIGDADRIQQDAHAIQIGHWLDRLQELIADTARHGHIVDDLKTAWSGSRNLMMHSDPARDVKLCTLQEAQREVGVLVRAFRRGFTHFVENPIELKAGTATNPPPKKSTPHRDDVIKIDNIDEPVLLGRLAEAGYQVEHYADPEYNNKWRVVTEGWKVFCPRDPGDMIVVRGKERESFLEWYHGEAHDVTKPETPALPAIAAHIGVDEAGKGDYFGPLVVGAVYVTPKTALDLIRMGVRDSKVLSDATIADLALTIRERCPNEVIVLMPPEYNEAYQQHQNLNRLLAELHTQAIETLVKRTGGRRVVDDQFAAPRVLEEALAARNLDIELEQWPGGESDVAVAAASILARESFVAAIEDFRVKAGMEIPLGSSSPKVVQVGRAIVSRWGEEALGRIAKLNFKTTQQVLGQ